MSFDAVLIANRGEIAIRVARAAAELGLRTVAVYSEDDARSLHVRRADAARPLRGTGPAAYLDIAQLVAAAREAGCDAIHPGYGFLSESAAFAREVRRSGHHVRRAERRGARAFGDKAQGARARAAARRAGAARHGRAQLARGSARVLRARPARVMIKAIAGGGGRGMRVVARAEELEEAYARCRSEAEKAFGVARRLRRGAAAARAPHRSADRRRRHGRGHRTCGSASARCSGATRSSSRSRRAQRWLPQRARAAARRRGAARASGVVRRPRHVRVPGRRQRRSGPWVDRADQATGRFAFIEANARLQVEHTVTEEVTGIDLVQTQLEIARGATLGAARARAGADRRRRAASRCRLRINIETIAADGSVRPTGGTLAAFEPPSRPRRARRSLRLRRLHDQPALRLAAREVIVHAPTARVRGRARARGSRARASCASRASPPTRRSCARSCATPISRRRA